MTPACVAPRRSQLLTVLPPLLPQWLLCDLKSPEDKKRRLLAGLAAAKKSSRAGGSSSTGTSEGKSKPGVDSISTAMEDSPGTSRLVALPAELPGDGPASVSQHQAATTVGLFSALEVRFRCAASLRQHVYLRKPASAAA